MDSPISVRVKSFVRIQSNPNISFVGVTPPDDGRVRLLYVACRPNGANDVELRAVANRLLQDLGEDRARFSIKALRPPTYEQLQKELVDAKAEGRKHLHDNPDRWVGLNARPLQDWFVPVVYEAAPIELFPAGQPMALEEQTELDPVQLSSALRRHVPEEGFIGRDETLLALDRAFDSHRVVLLHAYAGQGKSSTAVEFARWYSLTGGLGEKPLVLFASFEGHTDLDDLLNQVGQPFAPLLEAQGIHWSAMNDTNERRQLVIQLLRHFPILWIWDNVEPVAGFPEGTESGWTDAEQNDLRDFLHQIEIDNATKVKILLTSRRDEQKWLGGIPNRIAMPRMKNSDAAKLALRLGEEKHITRSETADWQPLLDYCAGNPLTLRVLVRQAVKAGVRGAERISDFVEAIRSGEQNIEDADEEEGRDKSLGASLDYGFRNAFKDDELPIIALLHLFQGTVYAEVLRAMGEVPDHALPELKGRSSEYLIGLLERARDIGMLTQIGPAYFTIHPALPWFLRQLFARQYDGQAGRSTSQAALRAWVEAVGGLGDFYHDQFEDGKREAIGLLELEEANLLHARRLARRNQWWSPVISCMQGLDVLYGYCGRTAEWARLVAEIVPDYCTADNEPISGREDEYSVVMGYRVRLAVDHEHNLPKAAALQEKLNQWIRQRAAAELALPADCPLDDDQRNRLRTLAVSMETFGHILREDGKAECLQSYHESLKIDRRIGDAAHGVIIEFNLGHAYKDIPAIRDLDAAEAAYQRSLVLLDPNDALGRSKCIAQIGMVHHQRFLDARKRNEQTETLLRHAQAAEERYTEGLRLCPKDALTELAPMHQCLGALYAEVGQLDNARDHYEQAAQYYEKAGDRFDAGQTRLGIAVMYGRAAGNEGRPSRQRDFLLRARDYAKSALRDFQHFQGRAADEEGAAQRLLDLINQGIAKLEQ